MDWNKSADEEYIPSSLERAFEVTEKRVTRGDVKRQRLEVEEVDMDHQDLMPQFPPESIEDGKLDEEAVLEEMEEVFPDPQCIKKIVFAAPLKSIAVNYITSDKVVYEKKNVAPTVQVLKSFSNGHPDDLCADPANPEPTNPDHVVSPRYRRKSVSPTPPDTEPIKTQHLPTHDDVFDSEPSTSPDAHTCWPDFSISTLNQIVPIEMVPQPSTSEEIAYFEPLPADAWEQEHPIAHPDSYQLVFDEIYPSCNVPQPSPDESVPGFGDSPFSDQNGQVESVRQSLTPEYPGPVENTSETCSNDSKLNLFSPEYENNSVISSSALLKIEQMLKRESETSSSDPSLDNSPDSGIQSSLRASLEDDKPPLPIQLQIPFPLFMKSSNSPPIVQENIGLFSPDLDGLGGLEDSLAVIDTNFLNRSLAGALNGVPFPTFPDEDPTPSALRGAPSLEVLNGANGKVPYSQLEAKILKNHQKYDMMKSTGVVHGVPVKTEKPVEKAKRVYNRKKKEPQLKSVANGPPHHLPIQSLPVLNAQMPHQMAVPNFSTAIGTANFAQFAHPIPPQPVQIPIELQQFVPPVIPNLPIPQLPPLNQTNPLFPLLFPQINPPELVNILLNNTPATNQILLQLLQTIMPAPQ